MSYVKLEVTTANLQRPLFYFRTSFSTCIMYASFEQRPRVDNGYSFRVSFYVKTWMRYTFYQFKFFSCLCFYVNCSFCLQAEFRWSIAKSSFEKEIARIRRKVVTFFSTMKVLENFQLPKVGKNLFNFGDDRNVSFDETVIFHINIFPCHIAQNIIYSIQRRRRGR